jgi:amino acid adenylation domain-containing protein
MGEKCIHEIFELHAGAHPGATALVLGDAHWTYGQLNRRANRVAEHLRAMGVGRESIIALDMDRSFELFAAMLGVLKAGGAYVPLDRNEPEARRAALLADLQPACVLTSIPDGEADNVENVARADSLAYILYTSGSTGAPKGVMVEHRAVVRLVCDPNYVDLGPDQVFLQLAPLPFDASTFEIWGALLNGARLAVMPAGLPALAEIARAIRTHGVTTLWLTSGLFQAMVDQQVDSLAGLRQLLAGGDVLSPLHVRRFLDAAPGARLINGYGPTENTTFTCCYTVPADHPAGAAIPIGTAISGTTVYLLNEQDGQLRPVADGETGELYAGGIGVARGYWRQPELTAERFIEVDGERLYRTGDLARRRPDGVLEFLGRVDSQIKLRGFRIEPGEIETALNGLASVSQSAVVAEGASAEKRLVAYVVPAAGRRPNVAALREEARAKLPPYMIPAEFVVLPSLPLNANGKVDRRALQRPDYEHTIAVVWSEVLGVETPDPAASFFDLGGSSLQLLRVHGFLEQRLPVGLAIADLFRFPSIRALAEHCRGGSPAPELAARRGERSPEIAIVGMAARLPGAKDVREFWENLKNGVESVSFFTDAELEVPAAAGAVKARPILDDVDLFDAAHFGILPKEAEAIDPQQRVFLECAVEALDDAGYDPARYAGAIGVFAGCSPNTYFLRHLCADREYIDDYTSQYQVGNYQTMLGSSPDFLPTRVSYKLNLTGPSIFVGTACSTSLVAVAQACESLIGGQSDMALAGGVSITFPQKRAYSYQEGGIASADGHCRAFDADAQGTVFGSGCGVVLLKRLADAVADGDSIYAVIKGYGLSNDGSGKMAFTAPGVDGQAKAIQRAQEMAGVSPESIGYVEAHGTGTPLGDPIEVAALTQVFRAGTDARQFCALGTAKTNVGHLDAAAGVTGLIKAALSVRDGVLPPTLHFKRPNPRIDFAASPFYVNAELAEWKPVRSPRRAGVSAFGVGGTNAHVILEEAPASCQDARPSGFAAAPLLLSARTEAALEAATSRLEAHLAAHAELDPADVAWTLATGRRRMEHRRVLIAGTSATQKLDRALPVAFAFPGQGSQHAAMGRELYASLPVFRRCVDECAAILGASPFDAADLNETAAAQPAIFTIEYALAKEWIAWGVEPAAMLGHSVGEFVAAALAGVFSLKDALELVAARGRLMQALPRGAMLSVRLAEAELRPLLSEEISVAAVNSPSLCVVAGPCEAIEALEQVLTARNVACRKLRTSHAFHSQMVDPIVAELTEEIRKIALSAPKIPYVSTLTGEWITAEQATDPAYWARHCRETVRFSAAVERLKQDKAYCVLEVGPGQALTTLVRQHGVAAVGSLPGASAMQSELTALLAAAGRLWLHGVEPDWNQVLQGPRRRVSLPGTAFDRKRYWVDAPQKVIATPQERNPIVSIAVAAPAPGRADRLRRELRALFEDLSGMELGSVAPGTSFLEIGFDSLFLTQAAQAIESKYGAKIRFAQLLDDLSTFERLAEYLDAGLPAEAAPVAPAPAGGLLEQLLKDQLQAFAELTARQLEAFRGTPAPAAVPVRNEAKFESFGPYKPVQKGPAGGLSPEQSDYLRRFIARYTARTPESKRLTQQHRARLADPRVASGFRLQWKDLVYPIQIERSRGSKLWDVDGNEYIDILNGFGVTLFGHAPDFVRDAVREQLERGIEIGPQTPLAGKVAELLCELTGMERATFCNTGSEAVMAAMRLARTVTGKNKIVYFTGDYHGAFDEVLIKASGKKYRPIAPGIPDEKAANVMVLEYGAAASLETIRAHAHELAAVIVEPVQSRHCNLQPVEFLRELRAITEKTNTALIFDEVVTGFRTHPGGAQALFGIRADLATYGKVIGGGLPIGALAGCAKYMDALDGGMWQYGDESSPEVGVTFFAGTFVRHPLAMAACYAVLNHLKQAGPQLQEDLSQKAGRLVRELNALFEQGSVPSRIENFRSIFYFGLPPTERLAGLLYYHLREKGIHIQEGFPCFLTTAHTEQDLQRIVSAFRESIAEMQAGGMLPGRTMEAVEPTEIVAPLTEAQVEIRLSAQLGEEESCSYNEGFTVRLRGTLNEAALREALQTLVDRHEALRATLTEGGDALRIHPRVELALPVVEDQDLDRLKAEDAATPFDLVHGPLVRAKLVRVAADDHVLFVTAHHIICDGWSVNVLLDELSKLYAGEAKLPVPRRFSEYARRQAAQRVDARTESYWVSQFSEPAAPLELPLDRPRPALKSYRGATFTTRIEAADYQRIKKAGAQRGATLFATLLSGFQALLSRITGQTDLVVGIPSAAQSALAGETLVGHCVNFLPIRAKVDPAAPFQELLAQAKRKVLEAYEHQSYTYGTLVRKLAIPRNPSRLPLIEVQFNLERVGGKLDFPGLQAEVEQSPKRFVNFDLFLNVVESPAGLALYCDYNTDLLDEATVARWLGCFRTLLLGFADDGARSVATLPLLSEADRAMLLDEWNNTTAPYPTTKCVQQLIDEQAMRTPHTWAATCEGKRLTYADLAWKSSQLASWLVAQGTKPNTLVGVSLEPSLDMLIAVLGVMKAGAAYVPLDPDYPAERLEFIRKDAGLQTVLTSANWPALEAQPLASLPTVRSSDLAYVIYTSGSTGQPKGVEISHRALVNFLCSMQREPGMTASDKLLAVTTLSFDIAGLELYLPLISGAEVVIAGRDAARDGRALATLLEMGAITVMQATPTTWKLLLEAGWTGSPKLRMLCGGEEFPRGLANRLLPLGASLWNLYGPTETTIWSTIWRVTAGDGPVPIGRPIANTQVYVVDAYGQPAPIGVPGELCIAGDGLARGYLKRPELTHERFQANGYRTGDLVRYLPDGNLVCLGRLDQQVKIRGHRIELGEIEAALRAQPGLRGAAAVVREDQPGEKRLVAYVEGVADVAALRVALAQRLPDYMIPVFFEELSALPLTPNGKVDRRALLQLPPPAMVATDRYAAPRTEQERGLAAIWQEVLHIARIGIDDDLFSLGADSIHLFQIASRAARQDIPVTPKMLLQHRTVRAVVGAIRQEPVAAKGPGSIQAVPRNGFRVKR